MSIEKVRAYFNEFGIADRIREFEVSSATVELAAIAVGVEGARIAKSMSFKLSDTEPIIIVTAGDQKIDNAKYKAHFHVKAKMLTFDEACVFTGHAPGGVCSFPRMPMVTVAEDATESARMGRYPTWAALSVSRRRGQKVICAACSAVRTSPGTSTRLPSITLPTVLSGSSVMQMPVMASAKSSPEKQ